MKYRRIKIVIISFLFFSSLSAKEYFVATSGSDGAKGTISEPFNSIHKATQIAEAGDTVTLRGGEYYIEEQIIPKSSGKADAWILYRGMPGETATIDGQNVKTANEKVFSSQSAGLFQITARQYIHVKELHFRNSYSVGVLVGYSSNRPEAAPEHMRNTKHITIEGCSVDRSFNSGISVWYADSILITKCEITKANDLDFRLPETRKGHEAPHEAISICGARYFTISYNHVHHCYKEGIDCKEVSQHGVVHNNLVHDLPRQAYYADAWFGLLEDIEFHSNTAYNCMWGFAISVEGKGSELRNIRFHHNLIYNMDGAGVLFGMWGGDLLRTDIHIYNNTFYSCGSPQVFSGGVGSIDILSKNFKEVFIYRNICDKGWDYEMGFTFKPNEVEAALKERNFIAAENLFESAKNRPSRVGQFDAVVYEYLPPNNQMGAPLYRNELEFDFVPEQIPAVKPSGNKWKYEPSPWFGALKPELN